MSHRAKLAAFFVCAVATLLALNIGYSALNTLQRLDAVEAARDRWQRPSAVIQALNLKPGNAVADIGCGAGYFSVRLSAPVGGSGTVLAEDILRLPLVFLWIRTRSHGQRNVSIVHGSLDDPHLPIRGVDAVLIANTYHEFTDSRTILLHVSESLVAGGRLVVIDREPRAAAGDSAEAAERGHEISREQVEQELAQAGFQIASRQDRFIEADPDGETWWLVSAFKPQ